MVPVKASLQYTQVQLLAVFFIYCTPVSKEKQSVDRLDSINWMTWKFQIHHLLLAKGLWGYVDGFEVLP